MTDTSNKNLIYIDTSALRGMSFKKDVFSLLALSKAKKIRLHMSETTLWERGRQQYERDCLGDRVVPYPDGINRYLAWFKTLFESYDVMVIPSEELIVDRAAFHIQNDNTYFSKDTENDQRDAHVLATAEMKLDKNTLILCDDKNLVRTFIEIAGFANVRRDYKVFLTEILGKEDIDIKIDLPSLDELKSFQISNTFTDSFRDFIQKADQRFHEYLKTLPSKANMLEAKLENMQSADAEIRTRVLGYAQWFSPLSKKDLNKLLEHKRYREEEIESNALRLRQENLIVETTNHWLINTEDRDAKEICEQAMAVVMPEILEIMGLK